ncbi:hypothetical protein COO91_00599 [Nostoc flagelliforme CCNUN1]|uniref:Uncharacterized protein n=1 Tax=Nostoc flagelliforme CCNUN1 TaxID=2038116 RepID=A0A2K8SH40_9NOSO|nr:hypothetical protein COO91_00599 [Nostoc flagelliforme CCNUN1]
MPLRKIWFLTLIHIWYFLSMRKSYKDVGDRNLNFTLVVMD